MGLARLVVIEGPDLGTEYDIPLRGGGIGREPGNVVQLSDPSVSRSHCTLEFRNGALVLLDSGSRNRTLVNGEPVSVHRLQPGDEIAVGNTRLAYLPRESEGTGPRPSLPGRVTMEVGSRELWQMRIPGAIARGPEDRARGQLASLARLGDRLRGLEDRAALGRAACEAVREALGAERACLLLRDAGGRMAIRAISEAHQGRSADGDAVAQALGREVVDKVMAEGKAVALDTAHGPAVASPLYGAVDEAPIGLAYADQPSQGRAAWDALDIMAASCLTHVISAALASFDAREALVIENRELNEQLGSRQFVGGSPAAQGVLAFVAKVGPSEATVLLTGESGSGKEMVARAIHAASRRRRAPFVAVNCAALTETLIESELFGHEKGAFTGASERKLGRFELADKGTLFLDEVGELPLNCQTKFLRVLEEQVFERVGGGRSISVDVRVVAATNRNLPEMVRRGQFRDDLYYRLSVIHTMVPPLRDRPSDIPALAEHFLARFRSQVARRISGFAPEAMQALMRHDWPGNVRELRNAVERAIVLGDGAWIRPEHLPPDIAGARSTPQIPWPAPSTEAALPQETAPAVLTAAASRRAASPALAVSAVPAAAATPAPSTPRPLHELEREGIIAALQATGGNKVQAAALLQIDRSTLYKKIKDYGING
jgi:DNA-binding NtrC family response regulator